MKQRFIFFLPVILFFGIFLFVVPSAFAVDTPHTWDGGGGDNNWTTAANWTPESVPASTDSVTFDATSTKNVTIDGTAKTVLNFWMNSGYSGIITLATNVTVSGGAFVMGAGTLDLASYTWTQMGNWTYTAGTFTANTSTVIFFKGGQTMTITGSQIFNNITIGGSGSTSYVNVASGTTLTVNGTITFSNPGGGNTSMSGGTIAAKGTISLESAGLFYGTTVILIDGTLDQSFTSSRTDTLWSIPSVQINKPSGILTLSGIIHPGNNWTYTAGTVNAGTSTVIFGRDRDTTATVTGSTSFTNLTIDPTAYGNTTLTIASGTTLTVYGTLTINSSGDTSETTMTGGTIAAKGTISLGGTGKFIGTTLILIDGTTDQSFTSSRAESSLWGVPSVQINKSSGTLTLSGFIHVGNDWTYSAGTVDAGTSTVIFGRDRVLTPTITGSMSFNNLTINPQTYGAATVSIAGGATLTVNGSLTIKNTGNSQTITLTGGTLAAKGAITIGDAYVYSGTMVLLINGTADQTITGFATSGAGNLIAVTINKSSGVLTLAGTIRTTYSWTLTAGMLAHDTTATNGLYFTGSGTVMTVGASGTWRNYSATGTSTINFSTGNVVSNSGTVDFEARGACGGTDIIALTTTSGTASWSGAGTYIMYDVSLTNQVASVAIQVNSGTNTSGNTGSWTWSSSCTPTFFLSGYRWFSNDDATTVTSALGNANTAISAPGAGVPFRLRFLLHVGNVKAALSSQALKLQVAAKSGSCDTAYSGETYADVATGSGDIRYYDNPTPADAAALTANGSLDPTHSSDTIVAQSYEEANNFTNSVAIIPVGQDGKWDVALVVNAVGANAYCFRVVQSDGSAIATPTVVPEFGIRGSLYSQNHANTSGDLYVYGNYYVPASGTDYWSYATNFDGASLTGSERRANVRLASSATVMVPSGSTLQIVGGSGLNQSTTVSRVSTGGYNITVAGTVNAQYYTMDYLQGANGFYLQSGATVTSISNGTFDNLVGSAASNDAFVTVDASHIGIGAPSKSVAGLSFANIGSGAECNLRVAGSSQTGYWNMSGSSGAFSGETYDCEPTASPGEIRWVAGGYVTSGFFISSTFDTTKTNGVAYNTLVWKGSKPANTNIKLQLATSNCSNGATNAPTCNAGAWGATGSNYLGSDCTNASFYTPAANTAVEIKCYSSHNNKRYFKYKVILETSDTSATPEVQDVAVNYSQ